MGKCFGCELNQPVDELGFHQGLAVVDVTACRKHPTPPSAFAVCERVFYGVLKSPVSQHAQQRGELVHEVNLALGVLLDSTEALTVCEEWFSSDRFPFPLAVPNETSIVCFGRELIMIVDAIKDALRTIPQDVPSFIGLTEPENRKDPFWFLNDCGIALEVYEALLGKCLALLGGHLLRSCEDAMVEAALTKVVIYNLRQYLRLLASHPGAAGASVPETLIPPRERFDLRLLTEQRRITLKGFEQAVSAIVAQIELDLFGK